VTVAAASSAFYVGLIGSKTKWRSFQARVEAGAGAAGAARVRCPAGLALGGRAPGEIAVGVVAEVLLCWHARSSASPGAAPSASSLPHA
jgi:xanthine dehydrogenase accessory factor